MRLNLLFLLQFSSYMFAQVYKESFGAIQEAKKYIVHAAVAYCKDDQLKNWNCRACRKAPNVKLMKSFYNADFGTRGIVLKNDKEKTIILSFRGAENLLNFLNSLRGRMAPYSRYMRGNVHTGFIESLNSLYPDFLNAVKDVFKNNNDYTVVVTGHSLGGALASLAVERIRIALRLPNDRIKLITYAQPLTGNADFARWLNRKTYTKYRVVNKKDEIPHFQLQKLFFPDYRHFDREIWIQENGKAKLCRSGGTFEDPQCSISAELSGGLNWKDHFNYFGTAIGEESCNP